MAVEAPLIVRVAGLPGTVMDAFTSDSLDRPLSRLLEARQELEAARSEMAERLYQEISPAPAPLRRLLLSLKRDCFNGRPVAIGSRTAEWERVRCVVGPIADRLSERQGQVLDRETEFAAAYEAVRTTQQRRLFALLEDRRLRRGVALSSPVLAEGWERWRASPRHQGARRERRLQESLLRYISRSALKLSPYSTLTPVALGAVRNGNGSAGVRLLGASWRDRSLLRLKRYLLDQYRDLLLRYRPFRDGIAVVLSNAVATTGEGRFLLLRPGTWELDEATGSLRYVQDALVRVSLDGPLINWLRKHLSTTAATYAELLAAAARDLGGSAPVGHLEDEIDRLLRLGFLRFRLPWPVDEGYVEKRLLELLLDLPFDPGLDSVASHLARLVELEEGYAAAEDPARSVREIGRLIDSLAETTCGLAGLGSMANRQRHAEHNLYEDVMLLPAAGRAAAAELVELSAGAAAEALWSVEPLARLSHLFNHRHDFLHAVGALMEQCWPGVEEVEFLPLFDAAQPLWRQFRRFLAASQREPRGWRTTFNPFQLASAVELDRLRQAIADELKECVRTGPQASSVCRRSLAVLAARVPETYAPPVGSCLFLQPLDPAGRLWMLNRLYEGTGRFGSRFTPVMDGATRRRYASRFAACSTLERAGEPVALLDLAFAQGDTLNVHAVQTPAVFEVAGEWCELPPAGRVSAGGLRVRVDRGTRLPHLVDGSGRRLLPVHLGSSGEAFIPVLFKFLWLFGPGQMLSVLPPREPRIEGLLTVKDRLTLGNVVLTRKRWTFSPAALAAETAALPEPEAFVAIHRWRREAGIPERVFVLERIDGALRPDSYKPQFIDFSSPLFGAVFRSILAESGETLSLEEVLPGPESFPRDATGQPWAIELVLDSLVLGGSDRFRESTEPHMAHNKEVTYAGRGARQG